MKSTEIHLRSRLASVGVGFIFMCRGERGARAGMGWNEAWVLLRCLSRSRAQAIHFRFDEWRNRSVIDQATVRNDMRDDAIHVETTHGIC